MCKLLGKTYIAILVIKHIFNEPLQVNRRNISLKYTPTIPKPAHKVYILLYYRSFLLSELLVYYISKPIK